MNCSLIRDLLPLYIEGDCSKETNRIVQEHLEGCFDCRELYELMKSPMDVKAIAIPVTAETGNSSRQLWKQYYGRLISRGIALFFLVYILVVVIMAFLK